MSDKTILVLGSGPGIGGHVASVFAAKRHHNVVLIARRADALEAEKATVLAAVGAHVNVKTYAVDTTDTTELLAALDDADATFGRPEVVFYNAARVLPSEPLVHPVEDIEYDLKVSPDTYTHTHTHTLSLSLSLFLSHTHTHSLSFSHTLSHSLSHSLALSHCLSLSLLFSHLSYAQRQVANLLKNTQRSTSAPSTSSRSATYRTWWRSPRRTRRRAPRSS
jgi:NAD(P)-dependent dehydrogenase (short-subunit alcohol dehydrogenase family)